MNRESRASRRLNEPYQYLLPKQRKFDCVSSVSNTSKESSEDKKLKATK